MGLKALPDDLCCLLATFMPAFLEALGRPGIGSTPSLHSFAVAVKSDQRVAAKSAKYKQYRTSMRPNR